MEILSYKPEIYKSFQDYKNKYFKRKENKTDHEVCDTLHLQVADLIKLENPTRAKDHDFLKLKKEEFYKKHNQEDYGNWVFYPWRKMVCRLLPEKEFIAVRTVRNKYKITQKEQDVLQQKKVGIVGLSVGQSVAMNLAMERIVGELRLADFDHLELSNLNRLRSSVFEIGMLKTHIIAREIAEIDPYLNIRTFDEGITKDNIDEFIGAGNKQLDLIIDECDSLDIKILLRKKAKEKGIPVIMETSDKGMIDIERYDVNPGYNLFHGKIDNGEINAILDGRLNNLEILNVVKNILDEKTMSDALKESLTEIGKTITTWPQLASAVSLGGGVAAIAARKIFLNHSLKSGRYFVDVDNILKK